MASDPVHHTYLNAGSYRMGVKTNNCTALTCELSYLGD